MWMAFEDEITPLPKETVDALAKRINKRSIKGVLMITPLWDHFIQEPDKILGMPQHGAILDDCLT